MFHESFTSFFIRFNVQVSSRGSMSRSQEAEDADPNVIKEKKQQQCATK